MRTLRSTQVLTPIPKGFQTCALTMGMRGALGGLTLSRGFQGCKPVLRDACAPKTVFLELVEVELQGGRGVSNAKNPKTNLYPEPCFRSGICIQNKKRSTKFAQKIFIADAHMRFQGCLIADVRTVVALYPKKGPLLQGRKRAFRATTSDV